MITEQIVNGRKAIVAFLITDEVGNFIPVEEAEATLIKVMYDDGDREFISVEPGKLTKLEDRVLILQDKVDVLKVKKNG